MAAEVIGFGDIDETVNDAPIRKKKNAGKKNSGGFQGMGLSFPVLKGIQKRGYKLPTPIQRKTIPLVLEGRDVVAMARTGSGKTACFLIPLFEKLKTRVAKSGARALILSPTRELALQTLKFIKELGRFTGLQAAVMLGGDSMDNQFSAIHGKPDIIVATPGRFMHICVEMELKLHTVEYVVFDEADRLFEMGFGEQLHGIVSRLPERRQTLLFSATLPKVLVEFAKAGLNDPLLLRLDVESKLPEQLKLAFICCRSEDKSAALLCLLKHVIKPESMTVLFAATKHHVEYLHMLLDKVGITNTFIYSDLHPSARKINAAKFQTGKVSVLIVTDVAARGIDIPQLDFVINYHFPPKPKLFVHRVGRCARAGRSGVAYSLVANDELAYLLDLHMFLGRPFNVSPSEASSQDDDFPDGFIGRIPDVLLDEEHSELTMWHDTVNDLKNMTKVCSNAYRQYIRSRPGASVESIKRLKDININSFAVHPVFPLQDAIPPTASDMLEKMKNYKPNGTVFEIGHSSRSRSYTVMKSTRAKHQSLIENYKRKMEDKEKNNLTSKSSEGTSLKASSDVDIAETFRSIIAPSKRKHDSETILKQKKRRMMVDEMNYIRYTAPDHHTEQGFVVNSFDHEASRARLDLSADNEESLKQQQRLKQWDRKKKKMVALDTNKKVKKIRDESGAWIPVTYKSKRYAQWKERMKVAENPAGDADDDYGDGDDDEDNDGDKNQMRIHAHGLKTYPNTHWGRHNRKVDNKVKFGLKGPDQILKARIEEEKKKNKQRRKFKKSKKKKKKN